MDQAHVLVAEDDVDINDVVASRLRKHGLTCTQSYSGTEAALLLDRERFDLIITDLMLPGVSGEHVVESLRRTGCTRPIIVISARTQTSDKVDLLRLGADDYLTKPFDLDELVARVEVQLRRQAGSKEDRQAGHHDTRTRANAASEGTEVAEGDEGILRFATWELDPHAYTFSVCGQPVSLTPTEFSVIELLMRHPQRVFSKRELFEYAWKEPYAGDTNTMGVHMSNIRTKLRASGTDVFIKTVWGLGFKLVEPEHPESPESPESSER